MFSTYDLKAFGQKMFQIRRSNGFTQAHVSMKTQVSPDTLRRIENGTVVPRFETLERLSRLYKTDLIEVLKLHRSNDALIYFHDYVDDLICSYETKTLQSISKALDQYRFQDECQLITPEEIVQYKAFLNAVELFNSKFNQDVLGAEHILIESLRQTISGFNIKNYALFQYNYIEMRILLLLSLVYSKIGRYRLSNEMLDFLAHIPDPESLLSAKVIIAVYANMAYNHHILDQHERVIGYAERGIGLAVQNDTFSYLYLLYFRKGIAEFHLGKSAYKASLNICFSVLKILGMRPLYDLYLEVLLREYQIVPDFIEW